MRTCAAAIDDLLRTNVTVCDPVTEVHHSTSSCLRCAEDHIFLVALVTFGIVFMPAWMPLLKPPPKVRIAVASCIAYRVKIEY